MLNTLEKKEMLSDAFNQLRRRAFKEAERLVKASFPKSLDEYIRFLMAVQKISSPLVCSQKKTITKFNKL